MSPARSSGRGSRFRPFHARREPRRSFGYSVLLPVRGKRVSGRPSLAYSGTLEMHLGAKLCAKTRSLAVWSMTCPRTWKRHWPPTQKRWRRGRTLRRWRAMSGSAGSNRPKNHKQELTGSNGAVPASKTESGDPVVGLAARIVEIIAIRSTPRKTSSVSLPKPDCGDGKSANC